MDQLLANVPGSSAVVAVIPARGGSKGVRGKNLRPVAGLPLVVRAVRACAAVAEVDLVVVSTDDPRIAEVVRGEGAHVVHRPAALSGDEASSESALLHALDALDAQGIHPGVTALVQATSPFIAPADLARGIDLVRDGAADVAFSVSRSHAFLWRLGDGAAPIGVNHDLSVRLRRQDREPEFVETGAFYVLRTSGFRATGHRFFGRLSMVEVSAGDAIEIDTEDDLALADAVAGLREGERSPIAAKAVVTDFDGVHTDDRARVAADGDESVVVNRSDGMGVALLRLAGIPTLILSSEQSPVVARRAQKLRVEVRHGVEDKLVELTSWAADKGIALADIAYLGNDINDISCLRAVGHGAVVAGAHPQAREVATHILRRRGGDGAVRELADRVLAHAMRAREDQRG